LEDRPVLEPNAGGIDIGAREIYVAVPPDRDPNPVRVFATFTGELEAMADWLIDCGITTVAMESTGVYWIPVYDVLEQHGVKVCLTNARHMKNVPGRRTDWHECQWLQYLHSVGLLRASFRPDGEVCAVRTLERHRGELVQMAGMHVQHMHKALTQMNLQIHHVLSDLTGSSGLAIVDAILSGERDAAKLAALCDYRVRTDQQTIQKALVGNWREEHLFTLRQSRELYRVCQQQIVECEQKIETQLRAFPAWADPEQKPLPPDQKKNRSAEKKRKKAGHGEEKGFSVRKLAYQLFGVDVTQIPGLEAMVFTLFSELGRDMSRWPSIGCFVSWLGLCSDNDISGGRIWRGGRRVKNRAGQLFRLAAQGLHHSDTPMGDFLRRLKAKAGPKAAHKATARKIAVIFYTMVKYQREYDASIWAARDVERARRLEKKLHRDAARMGYRLVPQKPACITA
jgi:transposase